MSLRGICPCCHAMVSLDAMVSDDEARALLAILAAWPAVVGRSYVRYLGLFRHASRAVSWGKLHRLTTELATQIREERVVRDGRTFPAPHAIWAEAMEELVERRGRPGFRLPLSGHGYLLEVVMAKAEPLAEAEAKAVEQARIKQEEQLRRGQRPAAEAPRSSGPVPTDFAALGARLGLRPAENSND